MRRFEYIKLYMKEDVDSSPLAIYEIDNENERYATRMADILADGRVVPFIEEGLKFVTEAPLPLLDEMNSTDPQIIYAEEITKEDFEAIYNSKTYEGSLAFPLSHLFYISKITDLIAKNKTKKNFNNTGLLNYNLLINSCMSDSELKHLETKYGIELPQDYREYIMRIGNGGNQPGTGMFTAKQSLALMSGRNTDDGKIEYGDLTKYYCDLNLSGCDNLLDCYYETFGDDSGKNNLIVNSVLSVLDDYFTEEGIFKYQSLFSEDERSFCEHEFEMKSHLLFFSFDDVTRTQYGIALDGAHKGQVIYYSYEPVSNLMSGRNIVFTNMSFLEWMYHLYECCCNPYKILLVD